MVSKTDVVLLRLVGCSVVGAPTLFFFLLAPSMIFIKYCEKSKVIGT